MTWLCTFFSSSRRSVCCFLRCRESRLRDTRVSFMVSSNVGLRRNRENVRCLSIPQQAFLLLELLDLHIIERIGDEMVNVQEGALGWNLETSVLLADPIP